ncbi:MAG: DUF3501 family protein [Pseudomonadota bacterium]
MQKLTRADLMSLESYSAGRGEFRARVLAHKRNRQVSLGPNTTLYFEDRLTIQYQVQEMLRIERIFEADAIEEELSAYNPLVPDGRNWKATFMIEYDDPDERREALVALLGIEDQIWVQVHGHDRVFAIADEDLDRTRDEKTSAVHFLRFELTDAMVEAMRSQAPIAMGSALPAYEHSVVAVPSSVRDSLSADLAA